MLHDRGDSWVLTGQLQNGAHDGDNEGWVGTGDEKRDDE
jgi:hypothetical protein